MPAQSRGHDIPPESAYCESSTRAFPAHVKRPESPGPESRAESRSDTWAVLANPLSFGEACRADVEHRRKRRESRAIRTGPWLRIEILKRTCEYLLRKWLHCSRAPRPLAREFWRPLGKKNACKGPTAVVVSRKRERGRRASPFDARLPRSRFGLNVNDRRRRPTADRRNPPVCAAD